MKIVAIAVNRWRLGSSAGKGEFNFAKKYLRTESAVVRTVINDDNRL